MNTLLFFWQVIQKIPLLECKWSASIGECSVGGLCKITSMFVQHTDKIWLPKHAKFDPKYYAIAKRGNFTQTLCKMEKILSITTG